MAKTASNVSSIAQDTALDDYYINKCLDEWDSKNAGIKALNGEKKVILDALEEKGVNRDAFKACAKSRKWDQERQTQFFDHLVSIESVVRKRSTDEDEGGRLNE